MPIHGKGLFLTWPQCDTSKEQVLDNAKALFGNNLVTYVIAQEEHKDGNKHIHAWFGLANPINYRKPEKLDVLTGKHGNYQVARSPKNVMEYCIKEDKNWLSNFDVVAKIAAMTSKKKYVGTELLKKRKLVDLTDEDPSLLFDYEKWKKAYNSYSDDKQEDRSSPPRVVVITGPAGAGKTRWAYDSFPDKSIYITSSNRWWDGYDYQEVVVLDEQDKEASRFEYGFILRLLDRYPLRVPIKGGFKKFNSSIVVLTGADDWQNWWRGEDTSQFERRVTEFIRL